MSSITTEIQKLTPSSPIELFILDLTTIGGTEVVRFTTQKNELGENVVWQGVVYEAQTIQASGFGITGKGSPPRPTIRVANIGGGLSRLCVQYQDMVGAKLIRKRTFARYLDAVNFVAGNPTADPTAELPNDVYSVERKANENPIFVESEFRWSFDLQGITAPHRLILQTVCTWEYLKDGCDWLPVAGHYFDVNDQPCAAGLDRCSNRLSGCKLRFGAKGDLAFGGFPSAGMVRR